MPRLPAYGFVLTPRQRFELFFRAYISIAVDIDQITVLGATSDGGDHFGAQVTGRREYYFLSCLQHGVHPDKAKFCIYYTIILILMSCYNVHYIDNFCGNDYAKIKLLYPSMVRHRGRVR